MVYHATILSAREQYDLNLSLHLRKEGKILTPGNPFEASDKTEIDALIAFNLFQSENFNPAKHGKGRIFRSHLVREIKGKTTEKPVRKVMTSDSRIWR